MKELLSRMGPAETLQINLSTSFDCITRALNDFLNKQKQSWKIITKTILSVKIAFALWGAYWSDPTGSSLPMHENRKNWTTYYAACVALWEIWSASKCIMCLIVSENWRNYINVVKINIQIAFENFDLVISSCLYVSYLSVRDYAQCTS